MSTGIKETLLVGDIDDLNNVKSSKIDLELLYTESFKND
jgi:hypothetical protein